MKRKIAIVILTILLLLPFHKKELPYSPVIESGIRLYTPPRITRLTMDEYFLLHVLAQKNDTVRELNTAGLKQRFATNLFKRMINKNDPLSNIVFDINEKKEGTENYYTIKNAEKPFNAGDEILGKALYCDLRGYNDQDFKILQVLKEGTGWYYDTHYLLALLLLKENKCYKEDKIDEEIDETIQVIIKAQENDTTFSDLYAERIVFLYWAGYGDRVKKEWVDRVAANFNADYGWKKHQETTFSGHVTGLSLLSLIYFQEGKTEQEFYE